MAVPRCKRHTSGSQYVTDSRQLVYYVLGISEKLPMRFQRNYSARLADDGLMLFTTLKTVKNMKVGTERELKARLSMIDRALGRLYRISDILDLAYLSVKDRKLRGQMERTFDFMINLEKSLDKLKTRSINDHKRKGTVKDGSPE